MSQQSFSRSKLEALEILNKSKNLSFFADCGRYLWSIASAAYRGSLIAVELFLSARFVNDVSLRIVRLCVVTLELMQEVLASQVKG